MNKMRNEKNKLSHQLGHMNSIRLNGFFEGWREILFYGLMPSITDIYITYIYASKRFLFI